MNVEAERLEKEAASSVKPSPVEETVPKTESSPIEAVEMDNEETE